MNLSRMTMLLGATLLLGACANSGSDRYAMNSDEGVWYDANGERIARCELTGEGDYYASSPEGARGEACAQKRFGYWDRDGGGYRSDYYASERDDRAYRSDSDMYRSEDRASGKCGCSGKAKDSQNR